MRLFFSQSEICFYRFHAEISLYDAPIIKFSLWILWFFDLRKVLAGLKEIESARILSAQETLRNRTYKQAYRIGTTCATAKSKSGFCKLMMQLQVLRHALRLHSVGRSVIYTSIYPFVSFGSFRIFNFHDLCRPRSLRGHVVALEKKTYTLILRHNYTFRLSMLAIFRLYMRNLSTVLVNKLPRI